MADTGLGLGRQAGGDEFSQVLARLVGHAQRRIARIHERSRGGNNSLESLHQRQVSRDSQGGLPQRHELASLVFGAIGGFRWRECHGWVRLGRPGTAAGFQSGSFKLCLVA